MELDTENSFFDNPVLYDLDEEVINDNLVILSAENMREVIKLISKDNLSGGWSYTKKENTPIDEPSR